MSSREVCVLYGSQTGCARDVAERVAWQCSRRRLRVHLSAMDDFDIARLPAERCVIFVCSTTGQGDVPDNMRAFWRFLMRRDLPATSLRNLLFTVFGLGDSGYQQYNVAARRLFQRVLNLGGTAFHPRGLGDDQHDIGFEHGLAQWMPGMLDALDTMFPLPPGISLIPAEQAPPLRFRLCLGDDAAASDVRTAHYGHRETRFRAVECTMCTNTRLTPEDHFQDVRLVGFDLEGAPSHLRQYDAGDVALLFPPNPIEEVENVVQLLKLHGDAIVTKFDLDADASTVSWLHDIPVPITVRDLLRYHVDVCGTPRRGFFEALARVATAPHERERLQELSDPKNAVEFYQFCTRERLTYGAVLHDFGSCGEHLGLERFLQLVGRLEPRRYSVASSRHANVNTLELVVAAVDFTTPRGRRKRGLCSQFLQQSPVGTRMPIWVQSGTWVRGDMDKWLQTPLIMIGPGTGIAPFRAMLQERQYYLSQGKQVAPTTLVFGCRNQRKDHLFAQEMHALEGNILDLYLTAFSRDQAEKEYVQHIMKRHSDHIARRLLQDRGTLMLSGAAQKMPRDVRAAIVSILTSHFSGKDAADTYVRQLERCFRYQTETWS
ncbi:MAG: hypothetical protein MHM6MM_003610 [Cercozoa sp. M6MM]